MTDARLEFLVEPFRANDPGPHVQAVIRVVEDAGLAPDMGPFATTTMGTLETIISSVSDLLRAGFAEGATSIQVRVDTEEFVRTGELHGALERLIDAVERELGDSLAELSRADKQDAVRRLDDQGAFLLRGAVEDVAAIMGVSKVTLYSYLNAIDSAR